jgi:hypothetical protein
MPRLALVVAVVILVVHGFIHLMGATAYLRIGDVQGLPYKTTVWNGRIDLGPTGMGVFGALWLVPAFGFVLAGVALAFGWTWWSPVAIGAALASLVLTGLDWNVAYAGAILNVVIVALAVLKGNFK